MGGSGSGRYGWRLLVEGRPYLDVNNLRRRGALEPGVVASVRWEDASARLTVADGSLVLEHESPGGERGIPVDPV